MTRSFLPCQRCRSRKKRCYHVEEATKIDEANKAEKGERGERSAVDSQSEMDTRDSSPGPGRVSEYNPEYVLTDLSTAPESDATAENLETPLVNPRVGQQGPIQTSVQSRFAENRAVLQQLWYNKHKRSVVAPKLSEHHRRYLEDIGTFMELPRTTTDALLPLYISIVDDLIPIIDGASVFRDYSNGQASQYLVKAICLVTCKTNQAAPFLRLREGGPLLKPLKFASKLLTGLDAAIKADLEVNRVTKVQVLALMHLNNDGPAGMDRAASHLSQAICNAWSMSLHFNIPGNVDQDHNDLLWWSLRNFDRLNKPIMGAGPFMIDDTDIAIERIEPRKDSYRTQLMGVALVLGDLMKKATKIYKASSTATCDDCQDFPPLSDFTRGTKFDNFHKWHRAYLEIWYHVAAMLSCRYSGPDSGPYNRRLASAIIILDIIFHGGYDSLPPLPLVPYAMSMSTTMIYRALRDGQRDICTASKDLLQCCQALDALSQRWTSVKGVAKLAKQLLRVLDHSRVQLGHSHDVSERQDIGSRSVPGTVAAANGSFGTTIEYPRSEWSMNIDPSVTAVPDPVQSNQSRHEEQVSVDNMKLQNQQTEGRPGTDASYSQIDKAFRDLFDYGMPNVFQDPTTSEFLYTPNYETYKSSNFQVPSPFALYELEFGYDYFKTNNL